MVFLSYFCMLVGAFFIYLGYMIAFQERVIIYDGKFPEGIMSRCSHEVIGSDIVLLGIISGTIGFTELCVPEFSGRLFYFLIISALVIAYMIFRQKDGGEDTIA